jgi:DNA-binding NarL/FixJ family response regulator
VPIRILIADDHCRRPVRAASAAQCRRRYSRWSAKPRTARRPWSSRGSCEPDLILLDITMPPENGIRTAQRLRQRRIRRSSCSFSRCTRRRVCCTKRCAPALPGYVIKRAEESEILRAIQAAIRGDIYVHPAMTRALLQQAVTTERRNVSPAEPTDASRDRGPAAPCQGQHQPPDRRPSLALDAHGGEPSRQPHGKTGPRRVGSSS